MQKTRHPLNPQSNVAKFGAYDPDKYAIGNVPKSIITHEDLTPGKPPCLTQCTIAKFLQPLTYELSEVPPRPLIHELPDAVIENLVNRDKAFWVDKPGANAYTLHDVFNGSDMATVYVKPPHQDVFPRSYQYDLDSVKYRRTHACDGLNQLAGKKPVNVGAHCRDCKKWAIPGLTPFQLAWAKDFMQKRWKNYPDAAADLSYQEIKDLMTEVGRPYKNEAINWYYENYPPVKFNTILRKFSQ